MGVGPPITDDPPVPETPAAPDSPAAELPLTVIEPRRGWAVLDLPELWRYRELMYFLAWRDVKIRYKQTAVGFAWAVVQPVAVMLVMTFVLGRIAGAPGAAYPYWLFVLAGLVPWTFFSSALTSAGQSIVANHALVTKVYFPRLLLPLSAVAVSGVDFAIGFALLLVLAAGVGVFPGWGLLLAPVVLAVLVLVVVGLGLLLSAVMVKYRDFRVIVPLVVQLWLFLTPGIYDQSGLTAGPASRAVFLANPVNGVVVNFRAAVLGAGFDWLALGVAAATGTALTAVGVWYFRRVERAFADVI